MIPKTGVLLCTQVPKDVKRFNDQTTMGNFSGTNFLQSQNDYTALTLLANRGRQQLNLLLNMPGLFLTSSSKKI